MKKNEGKNKKKVGVKKRWGQKNRANKNGGKKSGS